MVFGTQSTPSFGAARRERVRQASDDEVFDAASVELCEDAVRIKRVVGPEGHAEAASARRALISSRNARTLSGVSSRRPSREIGTSSSVGGRSPARSRALANRPTTSVLTTQVYAQLGARHPTIHGQTSTGAFSGSPNGPSPALAHAEAADFSNTTERFGRRSSWVFTITSVGERRSSTSPARRPALAGTPGRWQLAATARRSSRRTSRARWRPACSGG